MVSTSAIRSAGFANHLKQKLGTHFREGRANQKRIRYGNLPSACGPVWRLKLKQVHETAEFVRRSLRRGSVKMTAPSSSTVTITSGGRAAVGVARFGNRRQSRPEPSLRTSPQVEHGCPTNNAGSWWPARRVLAWRRRMEYPCAELFSPSRLCVECSRCVMCYRRFLRQWSRQLTRIAQGL